MPDQLLEPSFWINIVALVIGPCIAVVITLWNEQRRLTRQRQMEVFRNLMKTRSMQLNPDHVGALNLVEIEFHRNKAIIAAYNNYLSHLNESTKNFTNEQWQIHVNTRQKLLTKLLDAMAKFLKFEFQQVDIFPGGYFPLAWATNESEQQRLRQLLIETLLGKRPLLVKTNPHGTDESDPFPPAPEPTLTPITNGSRQSDFAPNNQLTVTKQPH